MVFLQYISISNVNFFPICYFYGMFCASSKFEWCGVEEVRSGSFSYAKKDTKLKCRMVVFFIKIYKPVIFQHECIVSLVQSACGKALHCAWHFHRRNSSVLAYIEIRDIFLVWLRFLPNLLQFLNNYDWQWNETRHTCSLSNGEPITIRQVTLWFAYPELFGLEFLQKMQFLNNYDRQ